MANQGFRAAPRFTLSWPWVGFWLLNPLPWVEIAYSGYFDVLVSLACVAAVHSLVRSKEGASGTYLAVGILLKFMPIVILPFLVFSERRFHFRLLCFCIGVVFVGFAVSFFIWGTSTFLPLTFAATRKSAGSIYVVLASTHSPLRLFWDTPNVDWLDKPLLLTAGLGVFAWCIHRQTEPALSSALAVLVTLLFYRIGFFNYQIVFFSLSSYWAVSKWAQFKEHHVLAALLVVYFGFLGIVFIADWIETWSSIAIFYSNIVVFLFKFLLGCALFAGLVLSSRQTVSGSSKRAR